MTDREIYEEVRGSLMRFAASLVGPSEAADLVSEAVVATLQRHTLSSLDNPRAYLMQAVLNRARSRGRQLERERRALARHGPESVPDPAEVISDVTQSVAGLPPQQRAAIFLVYWEDMELADQGLRRTPPAIGDWRLGTLVRRVPFRRDLGDSL